MFLLKLFAVFVCITSNSNVFADVKNFTQPEIKSGGWTPIPSKLSRSSSEPAVIHQPAASSSQPNHVSASSSEKHRVDLDMLPIPVIKPHAHGATLGFDLPEQGLTLYLDIDELATKPLAQNIGLKVVTHDRTQASSSTSSLKTPSSKLQTLPGTSQTPPSPAQLLKTSQLHKTIGMKQQHSQKRQKSRFLGSYEGNAPSSSQKFSNGKQSPNKYQVGYIRQADLHKALKHVGMSHSGQKQQQQAVDGGYGYGIKPQISINYSPPIKMNYGQKPDKKPMLDYYGPAPAPGPTPAPAPTPAPRPRSTTPKTVKPSVVPSEIPSSQQPEQETPDIENEVAIISTTQAPVVQSEFEDDKDVQQQMFDTDEQEIEPQKQVDKDELNINEEVVDREADKEKDKNKDSFVSRTPTPSTNAHFIPPLDNTIVKPFPAAFQAARTGSCPVHTCQSLCSTNSERILKEASTIRDVLFQLNADEIINTFPSLEDQLQNVLDSSSYTLLMPSNDAITQLPLNLVNQLQANQEMMKLMIENHILDAAQTMEDLRVAEIIQPRAANSLLRVNSPRNDSYTINGQRVTIADQLGPGGGMVHVIDGVLYPVADKDILDTLKSCNRFDGFITLAEGTGFSETLKQSGPFTVFVPSNEALQKVPDSDLDIIRNNMTALREFLKYHVAQGSFFSNDLRDGQFIPSLVDQQPLQVGVRVDGCSRRLVEANVSPLYRADIPATNGVIHVVDWVLKPNDRDWCEGIVLPR